MIEIKKQAFKRSIFVFFAVLVFFLGFCFIPRKKAVSVSADTAFTPVFSPDVGITVEGDLYIPFYQMTAYDANQTYIGHFGFYYNFSRQDVVVTARHFSLGLSVYRLAYSETTSPFTLVSGPLWNGPSFDLVWYNPAPSTAMDYYVTGYYETDLDLTYSNWYVSFGDWFRFSVRSIPMTTVGSMQILPQWVVGSQMLQPGPVFSQVTQSDIFSLPAVSLRSISSSVGVYSETEYLEYGKNRYDVGYNEGYNVGIQKGNSDSSFYGLISAIVDAPVQIFTSLFDFEIMGVNVSGFVLSLLSVIALIALIRLFSGGPKE